jgi:DNA-binding LacI/PurR family transcriptional regulator
LNIRELARHLNVSIGTVSRALNGRPYVDEALRKRIVEAARELGYTPSFAGRSLRQGASGMVGMMLPISNGLVVADTIFMSVLEGLRRYFSAQKIDLVVLFEEPDLEDTSYLRRIVGRSILEGVIIADLLRQDPRIRYLQQQGTPFVGFGRSETPGRHSWIDFDLEGATRMAVARFRDNGHERIALGTTANSVNYGRVVERAFRAELSDVEDMIIRLEGSERGGYELGERWFAMSRRPTAMVLANEQMAIGLYRRLAEGGAVVGRDLAQIAIIEEPSARFLRPQVTRFSADLPGLGVRLGEILHQEMRARGDDPVRELWPMQLSAGESDPPIGR